MKRFVSQYKLMLTLIVVFVVLTIFSNILNIEDVFKKEYYKFGLTEFELEGIVITKYANSRNQKYPTICINAGNKNYDYILVHDKSGLHSFVEIGDSIFNEKGQFQVRIKRSSIDTTIKLQSTVNELWYVE